MDLLKIYEEYNNMNNEYVEFIEKLVDSNLTFSTQEEVMIRLIYTQDKFEELKLESDTIVMESEDENNLKDLRYLIVDSLFLSSDLLYFYKNREVERFKMRAVNYINKKRRAEMFLGNK